MIALKHTLLKTLLRKLGSRHPVVSDASHLRWVSSHALVRSHLLVVDTLRRVIIIATEPHIRIINSTWILHHVRRHAHMLLAVVRILMNSHSLPHIHAWLALHVLGVSVVLVVVLHLIN